jgi:hypothetical protein
MKNQNFIITAMLLLSSSNSLEFKSLAIIKLRIFTALYNTDFNEFCIVLTTNTFLCKIQWLLIHILDAVSIRATTPAVLPVIDSAPSVQTSVHVPTNMVVYNKIDRKSKKSLPVFVLQFICRVTFLPQIQHHKHTGRKQ